jgi:Putative GTP-binding controlling metal-binding
LVRALPATVTVQAKPPPRTTTTTTNSDHPDRPANHNDDDDDDSLPQVAPGQTLQHYSPNIPSYLIQIKNNMEDDNSIPHFDVLRQTVVLDMFHQLSKWQSECLAYQNMGNTPDDIAHQLFSCLRWAEQQPHAKWIVFPQWNGTTTTRTTQYYNNNNNNKDSILAAVADRLHRAASGRVLHNWNDLLPVDVNNHESTMNEDSESTNV